MKARDITITFNSHMYETDEKITMTHKGRYSNKDGVHYVMYTETTEEGQSIRNILKFDSDFLDVTKLGITKTNMFYKAGHTHNNMYRTALGDFDMCIETAEYTLYESSSGFDITTIYNLQLNGEHVSKCKVEITIE